MNFDISKVLSIVNFLAANGPGRSEGSSSKGSGGSWFVEVISWLADAVVNIATVVWGWLITIFYVVVRFCLNIIDILQMFVERLVGIQAYNQKGGLRALESIQDSDLIIRFITNETILKTFRTLLIIGLILLIVFSIIALIKQNYAAASGDGDDGKKGPNEILKKAGRAMFLCLLVPFLVVFGLLGSNAVLASVCNAIRGDNDLTIGGLVFTASTYEANKYRKYAGDGIKVPMVYNKATKVVRPAEYSTQEDMQLLFYELATGIVYIEYISDDPWFTEKQTQYNEHGWKNYLTPDDAKISVDEVTGSTYFEAFRQDFEQWNDHYFEKGFILTGNAALNEYSMWDDIMRSVYKSNWLVNKQFKDATYNFDSTYTTQKEYAINGTDATNPTTTTVSIVVNSDIYSEYESFATIELEYFVMADLIDYAIEHNKTFYYVNANSEDIKWSGIPDPFDKKNKDGINIDEYRDNRVITKETIGTKTEYYMNDKDPNNSGEELALKLEQEYVSDSIFYVTYYNGFSRLYFSQEGAISEDDGATYIICTKTANGEYIPVTQTTTTFRSSYLDKDYGGAIVARGIFEPESIIPKSYVKPTIIQEQKVDEDGNELELTTSSLSPFAIDDTYDVSENIFEATSKFVGKLGGLANIANAIKGVMKVGDEIVEQYQKYMEEEFSSQIGIYKNDGETLYEGAEAKEKGDNLLVNKNIRGYAYTSTNKNKIRLYDKDGRTITSGAMYTNSTGDELVTEFDCSVVTPKGYIVIQQDVVTGVVIPWFVADASNLSAVITNIVGSSANSVYSHNLIVAEYTYDQITIELEPSALNKNETEKTEFILLGGMEITGIAQFNDAVNGDLNYVQSGEFIVNEQISVTGLVPLYVETKKNLLIIDGEIFESDGDLFYGRDTARKYFEDIASIHFKDAMFTSLGGYITRAINNSDLQIDYKEQWKKIFGSLDGDGDGLKIDFNGALMALSYKAGLAANMEEYEPKYYSITEKKIETQNAGGEPTVHYEGTITYYDVHNRELYTKDFTNRTEVYGTATIYVKAVMGIVNENTMQSCFVSGTQDNQTLTVSEQTAKALETNESLYNDIRDIITGGDDWWNLTRSTHDYEVVYTYQFTLFELEGNAGTTALGSKISDVKMTYKGKNGATTGATDPKHLSLKNGNVVSRNGTEVSMAAAKGYISSGVYSGNVSNKPGVVVSYNDIDGKTPASSYVKEGKLTGNIWNIKNSAEYDNFYIYFLRGNFDWSLMFDFMLNLPTLSLVPLTINFTFRCQMGTTYDYAEEVIYRLQAGQFYLDYNFREASGIGITNLFRMSSINPFILIFSTVLVLKIIWSCVWGLILRIYNMLLLFIMLPAVCSTMPMDEGARFKKWKDEVIEQIFSAYAVLIMLNLYFVIVPIVKDVTSDLITATDLPTTITGMFGTIGTSLGGFISNIGSGIKGACSSLVGAIGLNGTNIFTLAGELTNAELNLLGYVNRIIYIMFFLVLTTMLANGKELISKILGLGALSDPRKDIHANWKDVKDVGKKAWDVAKKPVDMGKKLAGKAVDAYMSHKFKRPVKLGLGDEGTKTSGGDVPPPRPTPTPASGTSTGGGGLAPAPAPSGGSAGALPPGTQKHDVKVSTSLTVVDETPELTQGGKAVAVEPVGVVEETNLIGSAAASSSKAFYQSPTMENVSFGHVPVDDVYKEIDKDYHDKTIKDVSNDIATIKEFMAEEEATLSSRAPYEGAMGLDDYIKKVEELTEERGKVYAAERALNQEKLELQQQGKFSGENKQNWDRKHNEALADLEKIDKELEKMEEMRGSYETMMNDHDTRIKEYDEYTKKLSHYKDIRETNEQADEKMREFMEGLEAEDKRQKAENANINAVSAISDNQIEQIKDDIKEDLDKDSKSNGAEKNPEIEKLEQRVKDLEDTRTTADDAARIAVAAATDASMTAVKNTKVDAANAEHAKVADALSTEGKEEVKNISQSVISAPGPKQHMATEKVDDVYDENKSSAEPVGTTTNTTGSSSSNSSNNKSSKKTRLKKILRNAAIAMVVPMPVAALMGGVLVAKTAKNHKAEIKEGLSKFSQNLAKNKNSAKGTSTKTQEGIVPTSNASNAMHKTSGSNGEAINFDKLFEDNNKNSQSSSSSSASGTTSNETTKNTSEPTTQPTTQSTTQSTKTTKPTTKKAKTGMSKGTKAVIAGAAALVAPIPAVIAVAGGVMAVKGGKAIKKGLTKTGILKTKTSPVDKVNNSASGRAAESKRKASSNDNETRNNFGQTSGTSAKMNDEIKKEIEKEVKAEVEKEVKKKVDSQVKTEVEKQVNEMKKNLASNKKLGQTAAKTKSTKNADELDAKLKDEIIRSATKAATKERNSIVTEHEARVSAGGSGTQAKVNASTPTNKRANSSGGTGNSGGSTSYGTKSSSASAKISVSPVSSSSYDFKKTEPQQNEVFKTLNLGSTSKDPKVKEAYKNASKAVIKTHMKVRQGQMSEQDGYKAINDILSKLK